VPEAIKAHAVKPTLDDFGMDVYIIVSNAYGELDRLLNDTLYALYEIKYGTAKINRYRYEERDE
jgi:hypothetical protein